MLEYLVEEIGMDRLSEGLNQIEQPEDVVVTVHDPCHLIRHTSRMVMDYALDILQIVNGVEVDEETAHDSCCGGGGLVARHSPDVAKKVVEENVHAISNTQGKRVVTPCPLCTAQIEDNLFRRGIDIDVEDLSVFIARRLSKKEV
jgi:Fe-S oxidoreductase